MTWNLRGRVLIACNCDFGCPCNYQARPTKGDCEGGWIWSIEEGHLDDVDVSGRAVAVFADWPGAIHEGGGQASGYLDVDADDQQREALTRLVQGKIGGPWAIFSATYQLAGPHPARFQLTFAEHDSTAVVGDAAELTLQPIRNPVTGDPVHPEMVLPEGMVVHRAALAASAVFRVHDGVSYDHSGQYAAFGPFHYQG